MSLFLKINSDQEFVDKVLEIVEPYVTPEQLTTITNTLVKASDLATVATTGSYTDLINKPAPTDLTDYAKTADLATVATSGSYTDLSNKPALATVATSGSYDDLTNKPAPTDLTPYAKTADVNTALATNSTTDKAYADSLVADVRMVADIVVN
jgi:hypothetical protein